MDTCPSVIKMVPHAAHTIITSWVINTISVFARAVVIALFAFVNIWW